MDLQYLPSSTQRGIPTQLADLVAWDRQAQWRLLAMPFFGRLQPATVDNGMFDREQAKTADDLRCDPLLKLWASDAPDTRLPLLFAHRSERSSGDKLELSLFELPLAGHLPGLGSASLEEACLRMQTLLVKPGDTLSGVTATRVNDAGALSRPDRLSRLFNSFAPQAARSGGIPTAC